MIESTVKMKRKQKIWYVEPTSKGPVEAAYKKSAGFERSGMVFITIDNKVHYVFRHHCFLSLGEAAEFWKNAVCQ